MGKDYDYSLSASKLNLKNECDLCFWAYAKHKIDQPRGKFPTLPNGVDRVVKAYADQHGGAVPPFLKGQLPGCFYRNRAAMKKLQMWQSSLKPILTLADGTRVSLIMGFDEILEDCPGYAPHDWKTKGDRPKDSGEQYYQTQIDVYGLGMQLSGWEISGKGYLTYVWPESFDEINTNPYMPMGCVSYELESKPERALALIVEAVKILRMEEPPRSSPTCELCQYIGKRKTLIESLLQQQPA